MADKELVMELERDILWLEQGCATENEICEHIKQAIKTIIKHKETENPWHTGTPTEEGWYLCWVKFEKGNENAIVYYWDNHEWSIVPRFYLASNDIILAWMPITPYQGEKNNG